MAKSKSNSDELHDAAKKLGKEGGKKGGPARDRKLSSADKQNIASEGGKAKAEKEAKKPTKKKKEE